MEDLPEPDFDNLSADDFVEQEPDFSSTIDEVPEELRIHAEKYPSVNELQKKLSYLRKLKQRYKAGHPELAMWVTATEPLFELEKWYKESGSTHIKFDDGSA